MDRGSGVEKGVRIMTRYKRPSMEDMQRQVELFNHGVKEGDHVTYKRDDGSILATRTRSAAYILSGHTPVVFVEGVSGCVLLNRVSVAKAPEVPKSQSEIGETTSGS